jgi:hypothetical protein
MAGNNLSETLAEFTAVVQRSKNRLIAIPAATQRELGLARREDNHIVRVSIRPANAGNGRWNHYYVKLTRDNEFSVPAGAPGVTPGTPLDVKVHRVIEDRDVSPAPGSASTFWGTLLKLNERLREGWRTDGSERLDEYLNDEIRRGSG